MITIKYEDKHMEIPETCSRCPFLSRSYDMGATITYCRLKDDYANFNDSPMLYPVTKDNPLRDPDCPLKDGETYVTTA